jgi:hypothetical protein
MYVQVISLIIQRNEIVYIFLYNNIERKLAICFLRNISLELIIRREIELQYVVLLMSWRKYVM